MSLIFHRANSTLCPKWFIRFVSVLLLLGVSASLAFPQNGGSKAPNAAAGAPMGSYSVSDFEKVNLYSGNLNLIVNLLTGGGRGEARTVVALPINSVRWRNFRDPNPSLACSLQGQASSLETLGNGFIDCSGYFDYESHTQCLDSAQMFPSSALDYYGSILDGSYQPPQNSGSGWGPRYYHFEDVSRDGSVAYAPGILEARTMSLFGREGGSECFSNQSSTIYGSSLTRLVFIAGDGTEYELRDLQTGGQPHNAAGTTNQPYSRGTSLSPRTGRRQHLSRILRSLRLFHLAVSH